MTRALLSRVAESIFWVGRYVERAEGTARILDVSVYQALEQSDVEGSHAARRLLAVMGLPDSGTETLWQATERLATDPDEPLVHRRRAGRGTREHPSRAPRRAGRVLGAHQCHVVRAAPAVGGRAAVPGPPSTCPSSRPSAPA